MTQIQTPFSFEFISGSIAGFAQVFIGQPFDIIKIRLQTSSEKKKMMTIAKEIYFEGGIKAFWRGTLSPLLGVGAAVSLQFGVNENAKKILVHDHDRPTLSELILCGSLAGASNSIVTIPTEHIRIKTQIKNSAAITSRECYQTIYNNFGLKGLYYGTRITLLREIIGFSAYFPAYNLIHDKLHKMIDGKELSFLEICIAGACSGLAYWTSCFPFDVLKSKIQSNDLRFPKYLSITDCFIKTVQQDGIGGLFRGIIPCILRSLPTNIVTFYIYENVKLCLMNYRY